MHDVSCSESLKVLVVTEDRVLQRQLSQFFEMVGYRYLQAADVQSALAAVAAASPQILLIDADVAARSDWDLCRQLSSRSHGAGGFRFLLVEEPDESQLQDALEAGIDDFLIKPISYGELLSRLRSAARVLEFERRVGQQGRIDSLTGLLSLSAFTGHLRRQLTQHGGTSPRVACVVLDVDFFSRVKRLHGTPAAEGLLQAIAQELNRLRVGSEIIGCTGTDRFCVNLPGADEAAAADWAETAREALAAAGFKIGDATLKITVSGGVAGCETQIRAEQLIDRAVQALQSAKTSGRNCVVKWSERDAGANALAKDKLFERTVVRDVMTPCTVFLRPQETVGEAIELLERTRLDGIVVVETGGKLVGVCERVRCAGVPEDELFTRPLREVITPDVRTFDEGESLVALMEYFNGDTDSFAVVLSGGRPIGFVTCNSLVAMSRPVIEGSLAEGAEYRDTSEYLLVPDLRPLECEQPT
jgi:diguanylate cyclase (GGDEF)-like protein